MSDNAIIFPLSKAYKNFTAIIYAPTAPLYYEAIKKNCLVCGNSFYA